MVGTSMSPKTAITAISPDNLSQNIPHFSEDPQRTPTFTPARSLGTFRSRDNTGTYLFTNLERSKEAAPKNEHCE